MVYNQRPRYKNKPDGRFSAEATAKLEASKVKLMTDFECKVSIPQANYTRIEKYTYNGEYAIYLTM